MMFDGPEYKITCVIGGEEYEVELDSLQIEGEEYKMTPYDFISILKDLVEAEFIKRRKEENRLNRERDL